MHGKMITLIDGRNGRQGEVMVKPGMRVDELVRSIDQSGCWLAPVKTRKPLPKKADVYAKVHNGEKLFFHPPLEVGS